MSQMAISSSSSSVQYSGAGVFKGVSFDTEESSSASSLSSAPSRKRSYTEDMQEGESSNRSNFSSMRTKGLQISQASRQDDSQCESQEKTKVKTAIVITKTLRQEAFFECFMADYKGADFELKLKNLGTHLRARIQAGADIPVGAFKTFVEAVALLGSVVLAVVLTGIEKISESAAKKTEDFLGFEIKAKQRFDVLKAQALGTAYSVYAVGSPERAIRSAAENKHIGTNKSKYNADFWGKEYTGTRNYALSSSYYRWGNAYKA